MPKSVEIPNIFRFDIPDDAILVSDGKFHEFKDNADTYSVSIYPESRARQPPTMADIDIAKELCRMLAEESIVPAIGKGAQVYKYESHQDGDYATAFAALGNAEIELSGMVFVRMKAGFDTIAVVSGTGDFEPLSQVHQVVYHSLHVLT